LDGATAAVIIKALPVSNRSARSSHVRLTAPQPCPA